MGVQQANGYVVWRGKSPVDGAPLVAIATGIKRRSKNPKTGTMVQVYLMRADMEPHEVVETGADEAVCNDCEFRPYVARQIRKALKAMGVRKPQVTSCYVKVFQGALAMYRAWVNGSYPVLKPAQFPEVFGWASMPSWP